MSAKVFTYSKTFRDVFVKKDLQKVMVNWFPGHMHKGMLQMQRKLRVVDCIVEVHDARIPFSGRNPDFHKKLTAIKPHIFVLNKMDLVDMSRQGEIEEKLKKENISNILFTNCKANKNSNVGKILPMALELMQSNDTFENAFQQEYNMMIIGIPNVGKSSMINRMRNIHLQKKKSNQVGAIPGITRSVLEKVKIYDLPPVYLFDTPGILQPRIGNVETGMRLALCNTVKDAVVREELIADYLLYWLNKNGNFSYVDYLGIPSATDDVKLMLMQASIVLGKKLRVKNTESRIEYIPDLLAAARHFIKAFRTGQFGKILLDQDILNNASP